MKKMKLITQTLLAFAVVASPLAANESEQPEEAQRIKVGDRQEIRAEYVRQKEERADLFNKIESGEEISDEISAELNKDEESSNLVKKGFNASKYTTTHTGAFHSPKWVSPLGDNVELEDGSIWAIASYDRYKTFDWLTCDEVIIIPNHSIFSSFDYYLVNLNTGAKVKANLALGPIYNGIFTHWIVAIDYLYDEICLEDGSVWKISGLDSGIVNKWLLNDTVIIGINDGFFSGSNPNILINVNLNNHAMGKCIY